MLWNKFSDYSEVLTNNMINDINSASPISLING